MDQPSTSYPGDRIIEKMFFGIGELAEKFGVSTESLRNWEKQKLIPAAQRTPGGHRRYAQEHVRAITKLMTPVPAGAPDNHV